MSLLRSFTREKLKISWKHDEKINRLYIRSALGTYFFVVPSDWSLKNWSLALRKLAEVLIFQAFWEPHDLKKFIDANWLPKEPEKVEEKAGEPQKEEEKEKEIEKEIVEDQKELVEKKFEQVEVKDVKVEVKEVKVEVEVKDSKDSKRDRAKQDRDKHNLESLNSRKERNVSAISFSGGLDSCAIVPLLDPGFFMAYLKRVIPQPTMLRHKQQLMALDHIHKYYDCSSFIMESDIENISMKSVGRVGFPSEYACCLPCVILSDHVGITAICTGTIGLFLKGTKYHHFHKTGYFKFWKSLFLKAGLELFWPVGGVVDRGTAIICEKTRIPGQSCVRNDNGFCNNCFKCFRKNTLILGRTGSTRLNSNSSNLSGNLSGKGRSSSIYSSSKSSNSSRNVKIPADAKAKLAKKPLTLIELYQKGILRDRNLEPYKNLDLSYQSHYMKESYDYMVPERLKKQICRRLDRLLGPMNEKQIKVVKTLNVGALNKVKIDLDGNY